MIKQISSLFNLQTVAKVFKTQFQSITSAAIVISLAGLASRILGLVRDRMLATEFGAGQTLDIYYAAFRIPDLVYNLLVLGALSAGFIPIFTSYLTIKKENGEITGNNKAWDLVNNILWIVSIFIIITCVLSIIFTPYLVEYIVPGFNIAQKELTIELTRILFLSPIFLSISSIFGGILQSFKRFVLYSLAPILYNVGIIVGIVWFYDIWGIHGLGYGVILGAFLHMLIQIPPAIKLGYRLRWTLNLKNKGLRTILSMMVPRTLTLGIIQVNLVIITIIASTLEAGSLSIFNLANNLQYVPVGLFGIPFAIAAFPTLSYYADINDWKSFNKTFSGVVKEILFFIIPLSALFFVFRAQIVRLILGAGQFGWRDTVLTFQTLGLFSVSLFAQSIIPLLTRAFYTIHDTKNPLIVALISMGLNIVLSFVFSVYFGVLGLALGFSIASIIQMVVLWLVLHAKVGQLTITDFSTSLFKLLLATLGMGIVAQAGKFVYEPLVDTTRVFGLLFQTLLSAGTGIAVFVVLSLGMKNQEMLTFIQAFKRKLLKKVDIPQANIE